MAGAGTDERKGDAMKTVPVKSVTIVSKDERTCHSCGATFFDMSGDKKACPECGSEKISPPPQK
jgi:predicted Zn-ribbon and HTH transcriptional regulator